VFRTAEELGLDLTGMGEGPSMSMDEEAESLEDLDTSDIDLSLEFGEDEESSVEVGGEE
jgi:hypothetical protein